MVTDSVHHYQGEAGRRYHFDKRGIPADAYPWIARLRAEKFGAHVRPADVVFEFGVGAGWNLAALDCARRLGHDVTEFLEPELSRRGIEFVADTRRLAAGAVDVVICHHVLEHVMEPAAVLREILRLLRPGGTLLVSVPFERERRYRRYESTEPNHHLYSWNPQTLGNLISESGLIVVSAGLGQFGYDRFAAVWAARLRAGELGFRWIRTVAHGLQPGREVRVVARSKVTQPKLPVDGLTATEEKKGHGQNAARPDFSLRQDQPGAFCPVAG
jgi:SAM-dependent methyltransferase